MSLAQLIGPKQSFKTKAIYPKPTSGQRPPSGIRSGLHVIDLGCKRCQADSICYFECLRVGVAGFSALAAERTSSFVNTAKRNGCDSRK